MPRFHELATYAYDPLHEFWERRGTKRGLATILLVAFVLGIVGIELNRHGLLPPWLAQHTPYKHFYAIKLAFTLVLLIEVVDLVFVIPCSLSKAVGKQFQILSLILLRNAFKELIHFEEPIQITSPFEQILPIVSDCTGAVLIFVGLGIYYRMQKPHRSDVKLDLYRFVAAKKAVALLLLLLFSLSGVWVMYVFFTGGARLDFFEVVYTILIFSDILLVLIAQRHQPAFHAIFRNSGYAVATLLIRLALAAPRYFDAGIGLFAVLYAVGLTMAYNAYGEEAERQSKG